MSEWVESLSSEGKIYFYNKKTGESRWTDPVEDSIPKEKCWIMLSDADGHNFYFNTSTKESTWKKPDSYDQRHDMEVRIKRERQDFFIMLSSSVPKDLNLNEITQRTPAIYTMKELSSRFDTDPRLINTPQIRRERYLDEWVTLERKRRVELEKSMIDRLQQQVKERLEDMVKSGQINVKTKWDDVLQIFKFDNSWKLLLNIDRIRVFSQVMKEIYRDDTDKYESEMYDLKRVEAERRKRFDEEMRQKLNEFGTKVLNFSYSDVREILESLPSYEGIASNIHGSTPEDLFYDCIEELQDALVLKALSIKISNEEELFSGKVFMETHKEEMNDLNEDEKTFVYRYTRMNYITKKVDSSESEAEARKAIMRLYKLTPQLVKCSNYSAAKGLLSGNETFMLIESDDIKKEIFQEFYEWDRKRTCEPGEIIPGDDDWEDITPLIENMYKK